jgi:MFS family permease
MTTLIAWRALQGVGAGGLTVTATALIGDVIPLRERGKYQGALGAVFGVTTVIGPLLGGVFTDDLSRRWVFYINVPIGVVVIALAVGAGAGRLRVDRAPALRAAAGTTLTEADSWCAGQVRTQSDLGLPTTLVAIASRVRVPAGGRASGHALAAKPARGYRVRSGWAARIVGSDVSRRYHAAPAYWARDGILGPHGP